MQDPTAEDEEERQVTAVLAQVASPEESASVANDILSLAMPYDGLLLNGLEDYSELLSAFSSSIEAFASVYITVSTDNGQNDARVRTFFATAAIPGIPEKIPVYGVRETRQRSGVQTYLKHEIFVFNGQERLRIGSSYFTLNGNELPQDFHLFGQKGSHNLLSGMVVNREPLVYDNKGQLSHNFTIKKKGKKKAKLAYESRMMNISHRRIADVYINFDKTGWETKKLKELAIDFSESADSISKPQVVFSSFLLLYLNKLQ